MFPTPTVDKIRSQEVNLQLGKLKFDARKNFLAMRAMVWVAGLSAESEKSASWKAFKTECANLYCAQIRCQQPSSQHHFIKKVMSRWTIRRQASVTSLSNFWSFLCLKLSQMLSGADDTERLVLWISVLPHILIKSFSLSLLPSWQLYVKCADTFPTQAAARGMAGCSPEQSNAHAGD